MGELEALVEILGESEDPELLSEFHARASALKKSIKNDQIILLMGQEYDDSNAILSIHPGAGGLDSQDWAEMIFRLYLRWAEAHGMESRIFDLLQDDEAGIKSVTFMIKGPYAYGFLSGGTGSPQVGQDFTVRCREKATHELCLDRGSPGVAG